MTTSKGGIEMPPGTLVTGENPQCETCKKLVSARDSIALAHDTMTVRAKTAEMMLQKVQSDLLTMRMYLPQPYAQGAVELIEAMNTVLHRLHSVRRLGLRDEEIAEIKNG